MANSIFLIGWKLHHVISFFIWTENKNVKYEIKPMIFLMLYILANQMAKKSKTCRRPQCAFYIPWSSNNATSTLRIMKRTEPKRYMMKRRLNINYKIPESFCFYSIILIGVKMLRLCLLLFVSAQLIAHQNKTKAKLIIMTLHSYFFITIL